MPSAVRFTVMSTLPRLAAPGGESLSVPTPDTNAPPPDKVVSPAARLSW
jgi:hypothetical protein